MARLVTGIGAAVIAVFFATAAWLVWPLPSAKFDWQGIARDFLTEGDCAGVGSLIVMAARLEPGKIEEFLTEIDAINQCPEQFDPSHPHSLNEVIATAQDMNPSRAIGPAPNRREQLSGAAAFWWHLRGLRAESGLGFAGWPEAVLALRCDLAFSNETDLLYFVERPRVASLTSNSMGLPSWERRQAQCNAHVSQELVRLERALERRSGGVAETEALERLMAFYRERVAYSY